MSHSPNVVTLLVFFLGVALCFWRTPQADRWHVRLCLIAAALWAVLLFYDPATRRPMFFLTTGAFLMFSLGQPFRKRISN